MLRDPIAQFRRWLDEAVAAGLHEPTAVALATVSTAGQPSARMVLIKGVDELGFIFATHYASRKALELADRPRAALLVYWGPLDRQVRIEGAVARTTPAESDAIFDARPRGARLGAWASPQSRPIASREELERRLHEVRERFPDEVPRPPFWGGFRLDPSTMEFWQGRAFRLHDRLRYARSAELGWTFERLAP